MMAKGKNYPFEQETTTKQNNVKRKTKHIFIEGDFMTKNVTGLGMSKEKTLKVKPYQGATTEYIIDYTRPEVRKIPNALLLHHYYFVITDRINKIQAMKRLV